MTLHDWVGRARTLGASDLHLEAGTPVVARVRGELQPLDAVASGEQLVQASQDLLGAEGWAQFRKRGSADMTVAIAGIRCRASFFRTVRGIAIAIRLLAPSVKDLHACNLHPSLRRLIAPTSGLVIVSGPTGSGKSTTLAALIEEINSTRAQHIVTLESPLEYLFTNRRSYIRQREIPAHAPSFEQGIVDALRENPDVLVIGEMRTPEVMRLTLDAAETGHLVLATMHSASCSEALSRLCMSFASELQPSIRAQLADCLVGVICQRLEFLSAQRLRVPRCELLLPSSGAKGVIRAGQFSQLGNVLQSGSEDGMWTFDRYQRWIDQNTDWVRPAPVTQVAPVVTDTPGREAVPISNRPASAAGRRMAPRLTPAPATPADDVIELPAEELVDLAELAELAKKIEERNP
jgi:twitching motility protein PilT